MVEILAMVKFLRHMASIVAVALLAAACSGVDDGIPAPMSAVKAPRPVCWSGLNPESEYLAVMGDVQSYTASRANMDYFVSTMLWVKNQWLLDARIKAMLYVGDMTDNNTRAQWKNFKTASSVVSELMPVVTCSGNHDYDWDANSLHHNAIADRRTCRLSEFASTPLLEERIVARFRPDSIDNVVVSNEMHGRRIDIIALEFGPRPEVLRWAADYVAANPDHRFIVMTHELLRASGDFAVSPWTHSDEQFRPYVLPSSSPEQVWRQLGYPYDNVVAMVCGHNGFSAFNMSRCNASGRQVPVVLFNLQYVANGGNGLIQLWEFHRDSERVDIKIVDTRSETYYDDVTTMYTFTYH